MRKLFFIQYATMLVLAFVSGVACYQLFDLAQITQVITWGDRRLLLLEHAKSPLWSVLPLAIAIFFVLFFSTHRYLTLIAPVFIALKITFFGFSSVFLLVQHESVKLYGLWWFPFQLFYSILLIVLYHVSVRSAPQKLGQKMLSKKRITVVLVLFSILVSIEYIVVSMMIK
ncbi:MAG: hypothetical protein ABS949_02275 [Solibacillus sp.]